MFQGMEYIYEVYKEKSFSKAAAALFISQPSLSANALIPSNILVVITFNIFSIAICLLFFVILLKNRPYFNYPG